MQKIKQSDQCRVIAKKKQDWNKYHITDPIFPDIYELNIVDAKTS